MSKAGRQAGIQTSRGECQHADKDVEMPRLSPLVQATILPTLSVTSTDPENQSQ